MAVSVILEFEVCETPLPFLAFKYDCIHSMLMGRGVSINMHGGARGICPGGCLARGMSAFGGSAQGVSQSTGGCSQGAVADTFCGQTDTCENITFANFLLRAVTILAEP